MGRPQFEAIVAQTPREKLITLVTVRSGNFAINANEIVDVYAPAGMIAKVVGIRIDIPAAGTSGYTQCYARFLMNYTGGNPNAVGMDLIGGQANFGQLLKYNLGYWQNADKVQYPTDVASQTAVIKGAEFDDTVPLEFIATNATNAIITGDRIYTVTMIQRQVAK